MAAWFTNVLDSAYPVDHSFLLFSSYPHPASSQPSEELILPGLPTIAHAKPFQCVSFLWLNCHGGSARLPHLPELTSDSPCPMVLRETRAQRGVAIFSVTEQVFSKVGVGPLCSLFPYPGLGVTLPAGPAAPQGRTSHLPFLGVSTSLLHTGLGPQRSIEITEPNRGFRLCLRCSRYLRSHIWEYEMLVPPRFIHSSSMNMFIDWGFVFDKVFCG